MEKEGEDLDRMHASVIACILTKPVGSEKGTVHLVRMCMAGKMVEDRRLGGGVRNCVAPTLCPDP